MVRGSRQLMASFRLFATDELIDSKSRLQVGAPAFSGAVSECPLRDALAGVVIESSRNR
jgi:hypothetical protein